MKLWSDSADLAFTVLCWLLSILTLTGILYLVFITVSLFKALG